MLRYLERRTVCPPITNDLLLLSASELAEKIRKKEVTKKLFIIIF